MLLFPSLRNSSTPGMPKIREAYTAPSSTRASPRSEVSAVLLSIRDGGSVSTPSCTAGNGTPGRSGPWTEWWIDVTVQAYTTFLYRGRHGAGANFAASKGPLHHRSQYRTLYLDTESEAATSLNTWTSFLPLSFSKQRCVNVRHFISNVIRYIAHEPMAWRSD